MAMLTSTHDTFVLNELSNIGCAAEALGTQLTGAGTTCVLFPRVFPGHSRGVSRDTGLAMILFTTTRTMAVDVARELKRIEPPPPLQDADAR